MERVHFTQSYSSHQEAIVGLSKGSEAMVVCGNGILFCFIYRLMSCINRNPVTGPYMAQANF